MDDAQARNSFGNKDLQGRMEEIPGHRAESDEQALPRVQSMRGRQAAAVAGNGVVGGNRRLMWQQNVFEQRWLFGYIGCQGTIRRSRPSRI